MAKPSISLFNATPSTINKGEKVTFVWAVANANFITITDRGYVPAVGSWETYPASTKTYTLVAWNTEGVVEKKGTITVIEPEPEPPPPDVDTWSWRFYTIPFNCQVRIHGWATKTSSSTGYVLFSGVPRGVYDWTVSKDGYAPYSGTMDFNGAKITHVTLEEEAPPPETFSLIVNTIPTNCRVEVDDIWDTNSGFSGTVGIPGLEAGVHNVTVSKEGLDPRTVSILIPDITEITIDITEAPDFWTDPVGWIQYFVISTLDNLLGVTGGGFVNLLQQVKSFFEDSWAGISAFFSDLTGNIQAAMSGIISGIHGWLDTTFNNIGEWWDSTASGIGEWWNSTTQEMGEWWESTSGAIGDWFTGSWEDITNAVRSGVESFVDWSAAQLTSIWEGIQQWVIDLITGLIASFNAGFDQGIEDQKNLRNKEEE